MQVCVNCVDETTDRLATAVTKETKQSNGPTTGIQQLCIHSLLHCAKYFFRLHEEVKDFNNNDDDNYCLITFSPFIV